MISRSGSVENATENASRAVMPDDGIVCLDNGMYKIWFARNYRTHVANTLLLDNALATMGAGLPSAMMAAMLHPDRRVMAVCGDGGFMMNSQEMETAVRLGLDLVVLVLNDGAYGMIRWKQAVDHFVHGQMAKARHSVFHQRLVLGLLHRLENQRGVGGGVLWLKLGQLFEVAGVGHHGGELFESVELVHGLIILCPKSSRTARRATERN